VKCTRFFFFFFLALLLLCRVQDVLFERMYSTNQGLILYFLEELQLQFFFIMEMDVLVLRFSYQGRQITGLEC
jgi:hypothetical protein